MMLEIGGCAVVLVVSVVWWLGGGDEAAEIDPGRNYTFKARRSRAEVLRETRKEVAALVGTKQYDRWRAAKVDKEIDDEVRCSAERDAAQLKVLGSVLVAACYILYSFPFPASTVWTTCVGQALLLSALTCCDTPHHASATAASLTAHLTLTATPYTTGYYLYMLLAFLTAYANTHIPALKKTASIEQLNLYELAEYDAILDAEE